MWLLQYDSPQPAQGYRHVSKENDFRHSLQEELLLGNKGVWDGR